MSIAKGSVSGRKDQNNMLSLFRKSGNGLFALLSGIGLLAGPEIEALSLEGYVARWTSLHDLALLLLSSWFRPLLWALFAIFVYRGLKQWADAHFLSREALDEQMGKQIAAVEARIAERLRVDESNINQQGVVIEAIATVSYITRHRPVITNLIQSYEDRWADLERVIAAGAGSAISWQDCVLRLRKAEHMIKHRAGKAFVFRATINHDAINKREPPDAHNVDDEAIRRSYRELWKEDLAHREYIKQLNVSLDTQLLSASNTVDTAFTKMAPQTYLGLEGGPAPHS